MILNAARRLARKCGIDFHRANYLTIADLRIAYFLKRRSIRLVLDVGANTGQFAATLFGDGYDGYIISFEPLPHGHSQLVAAAQQRPNWVIAPRLALGQTSGTASFHVAGNSVSSSLLAMANAHIAAAPGSSSIDRIEVQVRRLDEVLEDLDVTEERLFLKLDTQGTEYDVLKGASRTLDRVLGLKVELSLIELYQGQVLFEELDVHIRQLGFELWDLVPGFRDPNSARLLQFDGIYFRPET
jgi:FkbM family methyltransferase